MQDYNQSLRKERKRKARLIILIIGILMILGGAGVIYTVYFTDIFRFDKIVLNGATVVTKEELFPEDKLPFFFANVNITNLFVAKVAVHKNIFQKTLTVDIEERKPYGVWCGIHNISLITPAVVSPTPPAGTSSTLFSDASSTDSADAYTEAQTADCLWFDHSGLLFARAPATAGILVKSVYETDSRNLTVGTYVLPEAELNRMFSVFKVLDMAGIGVVKYILPDLKFQEIHALIPGGTILYFSLRIDPSFISEALQSLKPKLSGLKYADFRSENKVFYK